MSELLLHTKLNRPLTNKAYLSRPRLWDLLDDLRAKKLALISAPAGFGKTLLLASWLEQLDTQQRLLATNSKPGIAWFSLDEGDNDPAQFTGYLLAAVQQANEELAQRPLEPQPLGQKASLRTVISSLINSFSSQRKPMIIVLDDYHTIQNQRIHQEIAFWLRNMPPFCHLILSTRADPPLPLSQMRVRREVIEIRARELRLDLRETADLLNEIMNLSLSGPSLQMLAERTEGWAAGLQLAALALQGQSEQKKKEIVDGFGGSHMFVIDYFLEQVWSRISPPLKDFLLDTAVLDRLTAPLCNAISGNTDGQTNLRELQRQNLFIYALDNKRRWYRYHQLFAGLLRARLQQEKGSSYVQAVHQRASVWYRQEGLFDEAIAHALKAGDFSWAADLIASQAPAAQAHGRLNTILGWLSALPDEITQQHPRLLVMEGQALFLSGQIEEAENVLLGARTGLKDGPRSAERDEVWGELCTQLAIIAAHYDDPRRITAEAKDALEHLPQENLAYRARAGHMLGVGYGLQGDTRRLVESCRRSSYLAEKAGNPFLHAHILQLLGSAQVHMGQLKEAARTYRRAASPGGADESQPPYAGLGLIGLAEVQLEWMEIEPAAVNLEQGIALCERGGIGYNLLGARCLAVRLAQASGDQAKAEAELASAEKWLRANPLPPLLGVQYASCAARFWLEQGDLSRAQAVLKVPLAGAGSIRADELPIVIREYYFSVLGQLYLRLGQYENLRQIYLDLMDTADAAGRHARVLEISLQWALACQQMGEQKEARKTMQRALQIAAPAGYRLLFLECGSPMQEFLAHTLRSAGVDGPTRAYVRGIRQAFRARDPQATAVPRLRGMASELVEPLSERELEVLGLICSGLSNKQIGEELTISLNTVKKHTSHIYGKMQVNGRTQAIARAHELGLVE